MPDTWERVTLENCTDLVSRGYNTKYVEKSHLLNLNQKANRGTFIEKQHYKYLDESIPVPSERFAKKGDVLINSMGVGTIGRTHYWNSEDANTVVDQCITIVRYKPNVTTGEFLYLLLTSPEYVSYIDQHITGSTGMVSLNISAIRDCSIFLPDWNILENFHNLVSPLYEKIENNVAENERLAEIRDALLPKLMSGEIDVSKVDISDPSCLDKSLFVLFSDACAGRFFDLLPFAQIYVGCGGVTTSDDRLNCHHLFCGLLPLIHVLSDRRQNTA